MQPPLGCPEVEPYPCCRGGIGGCRTSGRNWVKSGTAPIIPTQIDAVNQHRGGPFWWFCTKESGFFACKRGRPPSSSRPPACPSRRDENTAFLWILQRKNPLFSKKRGIFGRKLPFNDISGNNFVIFAFGRKFCATIRNRHLKSRQKRGFEGSSGVKIGCFRVFARKNMLCDV